MEGGLIINVETWQVLLFIMSAIGVIFAMGQQWGAVKNDIRSIKDDLVKHTGETTAQQTSLSRISRDLNALINVLREKEFINSSFAEAHSPKVLSLKGNKLNNESGAKVVFELIKDEKLQELENRSFASLLDVENCAIGVMLNMKDDPRFTEVKNFVYNHPVFEGTPLRFADVLFVLGLQLRDYYFARHPEIVARLSSDEVVTELRS